MNYVEEYKQIFSAIPKTQLNAISEMYARSARMANLPEGEFDKVYKELTGKRSGIEARALRRTLKKDRSEKADRCISKIKKKLKIDGPVASTKECDGTMERYWIFIVSEKLAKEIGQILQEKQQEEDAPVPEPEQE